MADWAVRTGTSEPTGFGEDAALALDTYDALVLEARESGKGGTFELLKDGEVVGSAEIPKRGGAKP